MNRKDNIMEYALLKYYINLYLFSVILFQSLLITMLRDAHNYGILTIL